MSTIVTVERAIIQLGDIDLDVFRLPDWTYRLSDRGCEKAANKGRNNISRFRNSTLPEALPFNGLTLHRGKVDGERTTINLVPFDLAIAYWAKEAFTGNKSAQALILACTKEALERRADAAFAVQKTETEYNQINANYQAEWESIREYTRVAHLNLITAYELKKHPGSHAHDLMTTLIFGDTAKAARMKALVFDNLDESIGLNHQECIDGLRKLALAKIKYSRIKKGTWEEQIRRACAAVI